MIQFVIAVFAAAVGLSTLHAEAAEIHLSAAASLREVINDLAGEYGRKTQGTSIRTNYGASGTLAKQIEQGAPADLFISASTEWMDYLQARTLVDARSRSTFAYNALVVAGAPGTPVSGMKDLTKLRKVAVGSPRSVPAGEYAMESMKAAGIEKEMAGALVMAKDVREAMKYAEAGEVDGAFVYRTDALLMGKRAHILFTVPDGLHQRIVYPMALTVTGVRKSEAREFLRFLKGQAARNILEKYGFLIK